VNITAYTNSQSETVKVGEVNEVVIAHLQTGGQKCMEKWNLVNGRLTPTIKLMKN